VCVSPLKSQNQSQNHQFNGVIHSSDIKHDNNPGPGSDYVSSAQISAHISNDAKSSDKSGDLRGKCEKYEVRCDKAGKGKGKNYQDYNYNYDLSNSGNHFEHTFSSIGSTGAEIEHANANELYNLSFYELYKCAVECANFNNYNNNLYSLRDQILEVFFMNRKNVPSCTNVLMLMPRHLKCQI
jgi:hypothetical protein